MNVQTITLAYLLGFTLTCAALLSLPSAAFADTTSRFGGGNALLRGVTGIAQANIASDILLRLQFASIHGGQSGDESSGNENNGNNAEDANNESSGSNGENGSNESNGNNGGASAGNGGDGADGGSGGDAGPGGLIRAGNVVSKSTAINAINTVVIRIGR